VSVDPAAPHACRRAISPKSEKEPARPHSAAALGGGDEREHRGGSRAAKLPDGVERLLGVRRRPAPGSPRPQAAATALSSRQNDDSSGSKKFEKLTTGGQALKRLEARFENAISVF
jgi:hypothetical protein